MHKRNPNKGFTLVELSIVVLIIGLIAGGVLVGQDLVQISTLRSTFIQLEEYKTAVNAFRNKYNALPGDLRWDKANSYGMSAGTCTATPVPVSGCNGNGNGVVDLYAARPIAWDEFGAIFYHLYKANMIAGRDFVQPHNLGFVMYSNVVLGIPMNGRDAYPEAKIVGVWGVDWWGPANTTKVTFYLGVDPNMNPPLYGLNLFTPRQSYWFDEKIDDGLAGSGDIDPFGGTATCHDSAGNYNLLQGDNQACTLRIAWFE